MRVFFSLGTEANKQSLVYFIYHHFDLILQVHLDLDFLAIIGYVKSTVKKTRYHSHASERIPFPSLTTTKQTSR